MATEPPRFIQNALGIESDDVVNYCFPKNWLSDREQRLAVYGGALSSLTSTIR